MSEQLQINKEQKNKENITFRVNVEPNQEEGQSGGREQGQSGGRDLKGLRSQPAVPLKGGILREPAVPLTTWQTARNHSLSANN